MKAIMRLINNSAWMSFLTPLFAATLLSRLSAHTLHTNLPSCMGNISDLEYTALEDLFFATDGTNWLWKIGLNRSQHWSFPSSAAAPCNDHWQGIACGTESFSQQYGNVCFISALALPLTNLKGFLPTSLAALSRLEKLELAYNELYGTIPSALGGLGSLAELSLKSNSLTGPIPAELSSLISLSKLSLDTNALTGPISTKFATLGSLTVLSLGGNSLTGPIPSELSSLNLTVLSLGSNSLSGPIPTGFGSLASLTVLSLARNSLTGVIPSELGSLDSLTLLALFANMLTGLIPTELGSLPSLAVLGLNINFLTGSIPFELMNVLSLTQLALFSNPLSGTLPVELGNLSLLTVLGLNSNSLTGSIPPELGDLRSLTVLALFSNSLIGPIPSQLGELRSLSILYLDANCLTGVIPAQLASIGPLNELNLAGNRLVGTVPSALGGLVECNLFNLSANSLTGTVPPSLGSLGSQVVIFNHSTFNSSMTTQQQLLDDNKTVLFDLSMNRFTGTIPPAIFSKNMQTVSLYSNCFQGSLPTEICSATQLQTLVLDKLSSGESCESRIFGFVAKFSRHFLEGSLPSCVWSLPKLETLHIAGNGLHGTLGEIPDASQLSILDLSNNFLTGAVPKSMQTRLGFQQLLLAGNKLTGTLSSIFVVSNMTDLSLAVNRISGEIPFSLYQSDLRLNVLAGNIFSCRDDNVPKNDPSSKGYICGSLSLNDALIVWASCSATLCLLLSLLLLLSFMTKNTSAADGATFVTFFLEAYEMTATWWSTYVDAIASMNNLGTFIDALEGGRVMLCILAALCVIVCMPIFVMLKSAGSYGTVLDQYTWISTVAFLHGLAPATTVVLCVSIASVGAVMVIMRIDFQYEKNEKNGEDMIAKALEWFAVKSDRSGKNFKNWMQRLLLQFGSMSVVFGVNVVYVYVVFSDAISSDVIIAVQVMLGLFKLAWKQLYIDQAVIWMRRHNSDLSSEGLLYYELLMNLFNFVVGPYLATLGTDSRCLYDALAGEKAVPSSFNVSSFVIACITYTPPSEQVKVDCVPFPVTQELTISITPPWLYSYQCTSALITNYVPVLLLTFTVSGIAIPLVRFGMLLLPGCLQSKCCISHAGSDPSQMSFQFTQDECNAQKTSTETSRGRDLESNCDVVDRDLEHSKPAQRLDDLKSSADAKETSVASFAKREPCGAEQLQQLSLRGGENQSAKNDSLHRVQLPLPRNVSHQTDDVARVAVAVDEMEEQLHMLINPEQLKVDLLLDLAVLLTYGLAAPLLALAIALKQLTAVLLLRVLIGRILSKRVRSAESLAQLDELARCVCGNVSWNLLLVMFCVVAGFWSAMVFDMMADVYGDNTGGVVSLVVFLGWAVVVVVGRGLVVRFGSSRQLRGRTRPSLGTVVHSSSTLELSTVFNDLYSSSLPR